MGDILRQVMPLDIQCFNNMNDSVIIYRSRNEQVRDEFLSENPEYILGFLGLAILVIIILKLTGKIK